MNNLINKYTEWKEKKQLIADEFYKDPFDNVVLPSNRIPWLHQMYIGGSTDSALLGLNRWSSKEDVYNNMLKPFEQDNKFAFERGHYLEGFVADQFTKLTRLKHKPGIEILGIEGYPWALAQIDFLLEDGTPLEIKTAGRNIVDIDGDKNWGKGCDFNSKGELLATDDIIPVEYMVQCQKQMWLADKQQMWLAVWLLTEDKIRVYQIKRDDTLIGKIKEAEVDFLFNHLIPEIPYEKKEEKELDTVDEAPECCFADAEFLEILKELKSVNAEKNRLTKRAGELDEIIRSQMGEHLQALSLNGDLLCTLTPQSRRTFNAKAMAEDYPEVYAKYVEDNPIKAKLTIAKGVK